MSIIKHSCPFDENRAMGNFYCVCECELGIKMDKSVYHKEGFEILKRDYVRNGTPRKTKFCKQYKRDLFKELENL